MTSITTSAIVFTCVSGGTLLGLMLRRVLPEHHVNAESRDMLKIGAGLIATMAALLLGLLVASAKSSYDTQKGEITQMVAKTAYLDRMLAMYGPEAKDARAQLKSAVAVTIARMWPGEHVQGLPSDPATVTQSLYIRLQELSPQTESQKYLKGQALGVVADLGQTRWLLAEQSGRSISLPFLTMVVFWLATIFASYGLITPRNTTVIVTLLLAAFSVSGAFFLVLELEHPFDGLIQISSGPMQNLFEHIGK